MMMMIKMVATIRRVFKGGGAAAAPFQRTFVGINLPLLSPPFLPAARITRAIIAEKSSGRDKKEARGEGRGIRDPPVAETER